MGILKAFAAAVGLTSYSNGGGHHVHAQSSFRGDPNYDPNAAGCISNQRMQAENISHPKMTAYQQQQYRHAGKSGADFRDPVVHDTIAEGALKAGGMSCGPAREAVEASREQLNNAGCKETNFPWYKG